MQCAKQRILRGAFWKRQEEHEEDTKVDKYLSKLQEKYGYDDELVGALGKINPAFVQHLGQEEFKILSDYFENLHFVVTKPIIAKRKNGGEKSIPQLLEEAKANIVYYANAYKEKKEKNFSLEALEELDKLVTFSDRKMGMVDLKKGIQEKSKIMEEKEDEPRI